MVRILFNLIYLCFHVLSKELVHELECFLPLHILRYQRFQKRFGCNLSTVCHLWTWTKDPNQRPNDVPPRMCQPLPLHTESEQQPESSYFAGCVIYPPPPPQMLPPLDVLPPMQMLSLWLLPPPQCRCYTPSDLLALPPAQCMLAAKYLGLWGQISSCCFGCTSGEGKTGEHHFYKHWSLAKFALQIFSENVAGLTTTLWLHLNSYQSCSFTETVE